MHDITKIVDPTTQLIEKKIVVEEDVQWQVQYAILDTNNIFWVPHHLFSSVWAFFELNEKYVKCIDSTKPQKMQCVICHPIVNETSSQSVIAQNPRCQKEIMDYNPTHGIIAMKNHLLNKHPLDLDATKFSGKQRKKRQVVGKKLKKQKIVLPFVIMDFFGMKNPYKSIDITQTRFIEDLVLLIAKGCIHCQQLKAQGYNNLCYI